MRQLQPVLWNKGAFLQPQHLQSQDLYLDSQLKFLMDSLFGYPYGFQTLTVDPARLASGYFGLAAASGIFPDGLMFDIPVSDLEPEPRLLIDAFPDGQSTLTVSLAIPHYRAGLVNVSFKPRANADTRFTADSLNVRDETSGLDEKPVQIARKNMRYLLPRDDHTGHSVLPVARVIKKGDRLELDRSFVPPLLHASANSYLLSIIRDITGILSARSQEQSQSRRSKNQSLVEYTAADTQGFWLHYTVNLHYPAFRNMLATPQVHPYELFTGMLSLAGALTAFNLKFDPNDLPLYNHDDLGTCFTHLDAKLRELLDTAIPKYFVALPLKATQQAYVYSTLIPEDRYLVDSRVFLAINSETMKAEQLIQLAPSVTKIASSGEIQQIINSAVPGVRINRATQIPSGVTMRLGYQYFQLETTGESWEGIVKSRSLAVFVSDRIAKPVMELVIVLPTPV
jgi:type VI secretion system protein ImpJ